MQDINLNAVTWLQKHRFSWTGHFGERITLVDNTAPGYVREYVNGHNKLHASDCKGSFDWNTDSRFRTDDISDKAWLSYNEVHSLGVC